MQGTVLSSSVISGDDGKRYIYSDGGVKSEGELKNGDRVDFVIDGERAKEIYLLRENPPILDVFSGDTDVQKLRTLAIIGTILNILGAGLALFFINFIGSTIMFFAIYKFAKLAKSDTLFKNYLISYLLSIGGIVLLGFGTLLAIFGAGAVDSTGGAALISSMGIVAIIGFALIVASFFWSYKAYNELSYLSENRYFLYAFYCYVASAVAILIVASNFILAIGFMLELVAWIQLNNIKTKQHAL